MVKKKEKAHKPQPLPSDLELKYKKRKQLSAKIKRLEKGVNTLKDEKRKLDRSLAKAFDKHPSWLLSTGVLVIRKMVEVPALICTRKMVGTELKKAFEYPKYSEEEVME